MGNEKVRRFRNFREAGGREKSDGGLGEAEAGEEDAEGGAEAGEAVGAGAAEVDGGGLWEVDRGAGDFGDGFAEEEDLREHLAVEGAVVGVGFEGEASAFGLVFPPMGLTLNLGIPFPADSANPAAWGIALAAGLLLLTPPCGAWGELLEATRRKG